VRAAALVQIGAFISFADNSINKLVVIMVIWADTFISTWEVKAASWGNTSSVVDCAFVDVNA